MGKLFGTDGVRGVAGENPGRGFLAGWSMGKNMASGVDPDIHETAEDAARMADEHARCVTEREREYQAREAAAEREHEEAELAETAEEMEAA